MNPPDPDPDSTTPPLLFHEYSFNSYATVYCIAEQKNMFLNEQTNKALKQLLSGINQNSN
jgi:hypothetical protein